MITINHDTGLDAQAYREHAGTIMLEFSADVKLVEMTDYEALDLANAIIAAIRSEAEKR